MRLAWLKKKPFFLPFNLFLLLFMDLTVLLRISNDHMFLSFKSNLDKINSHFLYLCLTKRKKWNTFQDFKLKCLSYKHRKVCISGSISLHRFTRSLTQLILNEGFLPLLQLWPNARFNIAEARFSKKKI